MTEALGSRRTKKIQVLFETSFEKPVSKLKYGKTSLIQKTICDCHRLLTLFVDF